MLSCLCFGPGRLRHAFNAVWKLKRARTSRHEPLFTANAAAGTMPIHQGHPHAGGCTGLEERHCLAFESPLTAITINLGHEQRPGTLPQGTDHHFPISPQSWLLPKPVRFPRSEKGHLPRTSCMEGLERTSHEKLRRDFLGVSHVSNNKYGRIVQASPAAAELLRS